MENKGQHITVICTDKVSSKDIKADELILIKQIPIPLLGYLFNLKCLAEVIE
jgi:hypothetical protein